MLTLLLNYYLIIPPYCLTVPVNNSVKHTNIQRRGWSHVATAAAPSDKSNARKARKKVSRDERRAMVESFVNEYSLSFSMCFLFVGTRTYSVLGLKPNFKQ